MVLLTCLYSILKDPRWQKIIAWSENGTSFVIHDAARFEAEVLPIYFGHISFEAFLSGLYMQV